MDIFIAMVYQQPALLAITLVLVLSIPFDYDKNRLIAILKTIVIVIALVLQYKNSLNQIFLASHIKLKMNYFERKIDNGDLTKKDVQNYKELDKFYNKYTKLNEK